MLEPYSPETRVVPGCVFFSSRPPLRQAASSRFRRKPLGLQAQAPGLGATPQALEGHRKCYCSKKPRRPTHISFELQSIHPSVFNGHGLLGNTLILRLNYQESPMSTLNSLVETLIKAVALALGFRAPLLCLRPSTHVVACTNAPNQPFVYVLVFSL